MRISLDRVLEIIDRRTSATVGMNTMYAQGYQDALRHVKEAVKLEAEWVKAVEESNENDKA